MISPEFHKHTFSEGGRAWDSQVGSPIPEVEFTKVIIKTLQWLHPRGIHPKGFICCRGFLADTLLQHYMDIRESASGVADGSPFL